MIRTSSRAIRAITARANHGGSTASWSSAPSRVTGGAPSERTTSWNGRVFGDPRQKRLTGLTWTLANAAIPGSTTTPGGLTSNSRLRSTSAASTSAFRRTLPRLSTARSWLAERLPREVRGTSSANGSWNGPTVDRPLLDRRARRVLAGDGVEAEGDRARPGRPRCAADGRRSDRSPPRRGRARSSAG